MMQYRVPLKVEANKLPYMWLSLMSVVGFAYNFSDKNRASKIEMENNSSCLGTSMYINSNIQVMDKVIDKMSLELFGFHRGGAKVYTYYP